MLINLLELDIQLDLLLIMQPTNKELLLISINSMLDSYKHSQNLKEELYSLLENHMPAIIFQLSQLIYINKITLMSI